MTSLKAYRVEFVEPLTEYPGTENGRGEHQNAVMGGSLSAVELAVGRGIVSDKLTPKN